MNELLKKGVYFEWFDAYEQAFWTSKNLLTTAPVLAQLETYKSFNVYCDASHISLGCLLMQEGRVVSYASH